MKKSLLVLGLLLSGTTLSSAQSPAHQAAGSRAVTFSSKDGLELRADLYLKHKDEQRPFIVLFHQAGWSRGEYLEIAPALNALGYNCLALDQRSGGAVNGVQNASHGAAKAQGKRTEYVDALPDMIAALEWARREHAKGPLIAWGSSYSSALVLKIAGTHPKFIDGALAFSPGEYFASQGKSKTWIAETAGQIQCPVWITSAKQERGVWMPIFSKIQGDKKQSFLPATKGQHGSRALWSKFEESEAYWESVRGFLAAHFPVPRAGR